MAHPGRRISTNHLSPTTWGVGTSRQQWVHKIIVLEGGDLRSTKLGSTMRSYRLLGVPEDPESPGSGQDRRGASTINLELPSSSDF